MSGSLSFSSLQQMVQHFENPAGDPSLAPSYPNSHPSGLYQFQPDTWLQYAPSAGVDTSKYPTAGSAPAAMQDAVFNQAVAVNGLGDWTCAGCNPQLTSYLQANPGAYDLPVSGATPASGTVPATNSGTTPAATGTPAATASASPAFYVIAIILVVFLLAAGMWGLIKGA